MKSLESSRFKSYGGQENPPNQADSTLSSPDSPDGNNIAMSGDPNKGKKQKGGFFKRYPTIESLFPEPDTYILVGGCSMTAGAEMWDWAGSGEYLQCEFSDSTWPERIREFRHPDKTVFNSAQSGIANQHIARRMLYWLRKSRPTAAYVMWTSIQRVHFRNHSAIVANNAQIGSNPSGKFCDQIWYPSSTAGMILEAEQPENKGKNTAGQLRQQMIKESGGGEDYENVLNLFGTLEHHHMQLKFLHDDLYWRDYLRQYCKAEGIPLYETSAWSHIDAWCIMLGEEYQGGQPVTGAYINYNEQHKSDPYLDVLMHNEYIHAEKVFQVDGGRYRAGSDNEYLKIGFADWWRWVKDGEHHPGTHPVAQAHTEWAELWCKWLQ
tara:strand:- start:6008 stop:7144 length:1137 start_codon:yes stop_codon:yes gene_type:complete